MYSPSRPAITPTGFDVPSTQIQDASVKDPVYPRSGASPICTWRWLDACAKMACPWMPAENCVPCTTGLIIVPL